MCLTTYFASVLYVEQRKQKLGTKITTRNHMESLPEFKKLRVRFISLVFTLLSFPAIDFFYYFDLRKYTLSYELCNDFL